MNAAPSLSALQDALKDAFTEPRGVDAALRRQPGISRWIEDGPAVGVRTRIAVYSDAYFIRLLEALTHDFRAVRRALGEQRFRRLVADFLLAHPSRSPNLANLGAPFPNFIRAHTILAEFPFLDELAALERIALESIYAPRLPTLDPAKLAAIPASRWPKVKMTLDPTVRLTKFRWPVHRLWRSRERPDLGVSRVLRRPAATRLLVYRDDQWARVETLEEAAWSLLDQLGRGRALEQALRVFERPGGGDPSAVQGWFAAWVRAGVIKSIRV